MTKEAVEDPPTCVSCREGHLVHRNGKFGEFYGCSEYPKCEATYSMAEANSMYDPDPDEPRYGE